MEIIIHHKYLKMLHISSILSLSVFWVLMIAVGAQPNTSWCTSQCNVNFPDGAPISFCGTDSVNYIDVSHDVVDGWASNYCYILGCNVSALYQGSCGCPNGCFSMFNKGQCISNSGVSSCKCNSAWRGSDCSLPSMSNTCSGHGSMRRSANGAPRCVCNTGWTGTDCSSANFGLGNAPWGDIFNVSSEQEWHGDKYGDAHPIFNVSTLTTIQIHMPSQALIDLLTPSNAYAADNYVNSNISFYNNLYNFTFKSVGVKVKGQYSRFDLKKGWNIKFDAFVSGQNIFGVKKLGLKPGGAGGDSLLKNMIYTNFQRAMGIPVPRASYALVYINDVFMGLFFMNEVIDSSFIKGRYSDDNGKGDLYSCSGNNYLQYFGENITYYQTLKSAYPDGAPEYWYTLSSGNGNWSDLVDVLRFGSKSTDDEFANGIASRLDLSKFLKDIVVESFMLAGDFMIPNGNNYIWYHSNNPSYPAQFSNFGNDFDEEFSFDSPGVPSDDPFIMKWVLKDPDTPIPFIQRVFAISTYYQKWVYYYNSFLTIFNSTSSPQQPSVRYNALRQFILPWVQQDLLWQIDTAQTAEDFNYAAINTTYNLLWRYNNVIPQVECMNSQSTAESALKTCNIYDDDNIQASAKNSRLTSGAIAGIAIACVIIIAAAVSYYFIKMKGEGRLASKDDQRTRSTTEMTKTSV